tara:strand:- start:1180 stop:1554 length:375 start_codon:yes stop_codon:yes gene_type:complete
MTDRPKFRDKQAERNWTANRQAFPRGLGEAPAADQVAARDAKLEKIIADRHAEFMARVLDGERIAAEQLTDEQIASWIAHPYGAKFLTVEQIRAKDRLMICVARWILMGQGRALQTTNAMGEAL